MPFFQELNELRRRIFSWLCIFILLSLFFFIFPLSQSFSIQFLEKIQKDLVPQQAQLIVISPISGFLVQMTVSLFLGFIAALPLLVFKTFGFVFPALYAQEKKAVTRVLIPSTILFILGCIFSYVFLIPFTFDILYSFILSIEVVPLFELNNFLGLVFGLMMGTGMLFLLPIFMTSLTLMGVVNPDFWKRQSGNAVFCFVVISAIITPDGTGITLLILTGLLTLLYFSGYFVGRILKRS